MIGLIIEQLVLFLRENGSWDATNCDAQLGGYPPNIGKPWYIAVHDQGVVNTAGVNGDFIRETYRIEVVPWIRAKYLATDKQGKLLYNTDVYRSTAGMTLSRLEREVMQVILRGGARENFVIQLNAIIDGSPEVYGNCIHEPLRYTGASAYELFTSGDMEEEEGEVGEWIGRRLSFEGLTKVQHWSQFR